MYSQSCKHYMNIYLQADIDWIDYIKQWNLVSSQATDMYNEQIPTYNFKRTLEMIQPDRALKF